MMKRIGFEVFVIPQPWYHGLDLVVTQWGDGGKRFLLAPEQRGGEWEDGFSFHELQPNMPTPRPTLSLHDEAAQNLMNSLWNAGLRPSGGYDNAGQLKATERHLADMRVLAFTKLEVQPPAA